jgi:MFS family permease
MSPSLDQFVPGTVHLIDIVGSLNVKKKEGTEIILQPQPSNNINDPLRWSSGRKHFQFGMVVFWSFLLAAALNFVVPIFGTWVEELGFTNSQLNISMALGFLFLAVGVMVNQPTGLKIGKRPIYLFATVIAIIGMAIGSQAHSIGRLYGFKILVGYAASPVDSLVEITANDLYFQHQRSSKFGILILALYLGTYLGPVAAGYIVDSLHWRWTFYIWLIILGCLLIVCFFVMQETTFSRNLDDTNLENEIIHQLKCKNSNASDLNKQNQFTTQEVHDFSSILKSTLYYNTLKIWDTAQGDKRSWFTIFIRPFFLLGFPAILFSGAVYGSQMMWLALVAVTQSQIYEASPYNFLPGSVGLTNLSACVGCVFGMLYGGYFVDWLAIKLSQRNDGIYEPEFRLWAMIAPTILNAGGILAYGLGSYAQAPWPISVVIGQGLIGFASASSGTICLTYAVDSYRALASEAIVAILVIRNLIGCGFTFAVSPWLQTSGLKEMTWLLFMISIVINSLFIIMLIWGKAIRRNTAKSYEKYSDPHYGGFLWKADFA